jgi:hypothetical protein
MSGIRIDVIHIQASDRMSDKRNPRLCPADFELEFRDAFDTARDLVAAL